MEHLWHIFLLGIIEGITEFLPISSTGHLLIAEHWLGQQSEVFNIFIQVGAVLAVVLIYRQRLVELALNWNTPANQDYLGKLLAAFGITSALGLTVSKLGWKLPEEITPIAWALIVGGLFIFLAEWRSRNQTSSVSITWTVAVIVGATQVLAGVFPGTSRSAATILVALLLGVTRPAAAEFSFLLGIPTMMAASAFSYLKHRHDVGGIPMESGLEMAVGFIVSSVVAFIAVKWLLRYIQTHTFNAFGWYRLALGIALLVWFT